MTGVDSIMDTIAYFEPIRGLNVYGRELLPHLAQYYDIDIYTDSDVTADTDDVLQTFPVYSYDDFAARERRYRQCVFQLRNNAHHVPVYDLFVKYGGVAVLHDVNISGIIGAKTLMRGRKLAFLFQVWRNEGLGPFVKSGLNVALRKRWPAETEYMMNRVACRCSSVIIVHNEHARAAIQPIARRIPIQVVRRGVPSVDGSVDAVSARRHLGLPEEAFVVISLGFVTPRKRIPQVLAAFARLVTQVPNALYFLVGQPVQGFDVEKLLQQLDLVGRVRLTGWVDDEQFYDYLAAAHVCVNLRYPVEGETSSTALRAMSYGKPTLVSNAGSLAELPDDACLKITPNSGETEAIYEALLQMERDEETRRALGERAQSYVRQHHTWEGAAQAYHRFLERLAVREH